MSETRRSEGREDLAVRSVSFQTNYIEHAEGSVLFSMGKTQVLCVASMEPRVPDWMTAQGREGGWVTAEYAMLPRSTVQRTPREINRPQARTQEIRRLIGRSLRASVALEHLGERTFIIDCDVLQADGGTRTASITGGYIALRLALNRLISSGLLSPEAIRSPIAAISVGIVDERVLVDLDYPEDARAQVDLNVVMNREGHFIELQGTAEFGDFTHDSLNEMLSAASSGLEDLFIVQEQALADPG